MMHAVDILVQPFGVQNSMPPVENKILNNEVEYYLAENYFPGWQWKSASHSHTLEDGIRNKHNWQIYTKMIQQ